MRRFWCTALCVAIVGCTGASEVSDPSSSGVDSGVPVDDTGTVVTPTGCKTDSDCLAGVVFTPADCASATCNVDTGACTYLPKDLDGDGIPGKACTAPGLTIEPGTDCDDTSAATKPGAAEVCDGKDNDCDGSIDEDLPMSTEECTAGAGECKATGVKTCVAGTWSGCTAVAKDPGTEKCDGKDNDCDGTVDLPTCECLDGAEQECGASSVGSCKKGKQLCVEGKWAPCVGNIEPKTADTCVAGNDDDCDGIVTNGPIPNSVCSCLDGAKLDCATALGSKGSCAKGTSTCAGGKWGACSILPKAYDTCDNGNDDSCDGNATSATRLPSTCSCLNGTTITCGLLGYRGTCASDSSTCVAGAWNRSTCRSYVGVDTCAEGNDNSCNGVANEGCYCLDGKRYPCSDPSIGICSGGERTCTNGKANSYTGCTGTGATVGPTKYRYDQDGDGQCAAKVGGSYPYNYAIFRETTSCSHPGGYWKPASSCTYADYYDLNPYYSAGPPYMLPITKTQDWGKPWGGGYDCQELTVSIDCGFAQQVTSLNVYKIGGGGTFTNLGCSGYGGRYGSCRARICDYWTESAVARYELGCNIYGATPAF